MRERKQRGKRRYFRRLERWATELRLDTKPGEWYDLWHAHPDVRGIGNRRGRARLAHLRALFAAFENLHQQAESWETPHQIFLSISAGDAGQDAIYVHTPNPNQANFPLTFEGVSWGEEWPPLLASFAGEGLELGTSNDERYNRWTIRKRAV